MREIKFRSWDGEKMLNWGFPDYYEALTKEVIWMQFTGLKDKNGKEIYEGDIVHFNTLSGNNMYYEVRWSDAKTGFKPTRLTKTNQAEIKVIGNIYENPELLQDLSNDSKE